MEQSKGFFFSLCSSLTICWHLHSALQKAFSPLQTDAHPSARAQEIDRLPGAIGPNRGPMMPSPGPGAGEEGTDDRLWNDGRPPPPPPPLPSGCWWWWPEKSRSDGSRQRAAPGRVGNWNDVHPGRQDHARMVGGYGMMEITHLGRSH